MTNVLSPNCPSITHVAFASLRVEPTLWRIGQAAGTAVSVALSAGTVLPLHDVPISRVQGLLLQQGVAVHYPFRPTCDSPLPPTPAPPSPCPVYAVAGAGQGNGNYTFDGMDGGCAHFSGPNSIALYRWSEVWRLAVEGKDIFYTGTVQPARCPPSSRLLSLYACPCGVLYDSCTCARCAASGQDQPAPPSTGWQVADGVSPAPSAVTCISP